MKNKNGFTLVELLATIAILGIIVTIAGVSVSGILNKSKTDTNTIQTKILEDAAKAYAADNITTCKDGCEVTAQTLINEGYIEDTNQIKNKNSTIFINKIGGKYKTTLLTPNSEGKFVFDFDYTGSVQTFIVPSTGTYKLEVWGAQGGAYGSYVGGKGGFSNGTISLTKNTTLYLYIGGYPGKTKTAGFNGGTATGNYGGGGGGATDVRIGNDSLYSRVIVAGGGGGAGYFNAKGGVGGGTSGGAGSGTGTYAHGGGGSQISGGDGAYTANVGKFGTGGGSASISGGGAGGGWYGGGHGQSGSYDSAGGGGSGWVYTADNFTTWQEGNATDSAQWLLDSTYYLTSAQTIAGNTSFTSPSGTSETGHTGNGYARITKQ